MISAASPSHIRILMAHIGFCKFLPRVIANAKQWSLKSTSRTARLVECNKNKMLDTIKVKTGLTLEKLNKGGQTGTTTTGNSGREFFSSKIVPVIAELVPAEAVTQTQENVLKLHQKLSVLLRIISSDVVVDMDAYKALVYDIEKLL